MATSVIKPFIIPAKKKSSFSLALNTTVAPVAVPVPEDPTVLLTDCRVVSVVYNKYPQANVYTIARPQDGAAGYSTKNVLLVLRDEDRWYPLKADDYIQVNAVYDKVAQTYVALEQPFTLMPLEPEPVIQGMTRGAKIGRQIAEAFYNVLYGITKDLQQVVPLIGALAQEYHTTKNYNIVSRLFLHDQANLTGEAIEKVLNWWQRDRNVRRVMLLGLSESEINEAKLTCDKLYEMCITNPYRVAGIPAVKCAEICSRINLVLDKELLVAGDILRFIYRDLMNSKSCCVPVRKLVAAFGKEFADCCELVQAQYGVVFEYDYDIKCAYIQHVHMVEKWMAAWLTRMVGSDPVKYDTPLDTPILKADGTTFIRHSAMFKRTNATLDQRMAVQGALDHKVCIITGCAGSGKCLAAGTLVRMIDGSLKKVEHVVHGDVLYGMSGPRTVLNTTSGLDIMYRIVPTHGAPWVCNEPHILTLMGLTPKLSTRYKVMAVYDGKVSPVHNHIFKSEDDALTICEASDHMQIHRVYCVKYSVRGEPQWAYFDTLAEAEAKLATCTEDIFDISLPDYLASRVKRHMRCFHVGVEYNTVSTSYDITDPVVRVSTRAHRTEVLARYVPVPVVEHACAYAAEVVEVAVSLGYYAYYEGDKVTILDQPYITRFRVEKLDYAVYYGFMLDGDGRFLLGDYTVTHNTSTLDEIFYNLIARNVPFLGVSFMGIAVNRMQEMTGNTNLCTAHRAIANAKQGLNKMKIKTNPNMVGEVAYKHLVWDEASMANVELVYEVLQAYPSIEQVTFLGDVNQLDPIQWGAFLEQMRASTTIPTYLLSINHRVRGADNKLNGIIVNCKAMVQRESESIFMYRETNNFTMREGGVEVVEDKVRHWKDVEGIPCNNMVVLVPYRKLVEEINIKVQRIFFEGQSHVQDCQARKWYTGDFVIMKANDKEHELFNGTRGLVIDINASHVEVNFGKMKGCHKFSLKPMTMDDIKMKRRSHLGQMTDEFEDDEIKGELNVAYLVHGYCTTVNGAQGTEFEKVIYYIPQDAKDSNFLNCRRSYVAISRAIGEVMLAGDLFLHRRSGMTLPYRRREGLAVRLQKDLPRLEMFNIHTFNHIKLFEPKSDVEVVMPAPVADISVEEEHVATMLDDDDDEYVPDFD